MRDVLGGAISVVGVSQLWGSEPRLSSLIRLKHTSHCARRGSPRAILEYLTLERKREFEKGREGKRREGKSDEKFNNDWLVTGD